MQVIQAAQSIQIQTIFIYQIISVELPYLLQIKYNSHGQKIK